MGYSFNVNNRKEFHRGDYIPYWKVPIFYKDRNGYSAFYSAYRYSTSDIDNADLYGGLYFDLDSEGDFEKVRQDALVVLEYLNTVYTIKPEETEIYYSGQKGVHIVVPPEVLDIEPNRLLNLIYKYIATNVSKYTPNKTVDLKIYDSKRMFRIPNTIHEKTGLYKIRLTYDELKTLSKEEIVTLAKSPRKTKPKYYNKNANAHTSFEHSIKSFIKDNNIKNLTDRKYKRKIDFIPPCIQNLLDNGAEVGSRNISIACLASFYKTYGKSEKEAIELIKEWNSKNKTPTNTNELIRTVKSLYSSNAEYGCSTFKLITTCSDECRIAINKNKKEKENGSKNQKAKRAGSSTGKSVPPSRRR